MANLKDILSKVNGASFVGIDTVTEPKLKGGKKNPYQGHVKKVVKGASVMVFQNKRSNGYQNMVNKRLVKEGKNPHFTVGKRVWGKRLKDLPIVEHNGKHYLELIFLKHGQVHYEVDGVVTNPSDIQGLDLNKAEGEQGGVDDKVIIRTISIENIVNMRINGETFTGLSFED